MIKNLYATGVSKSSFQVLRRKGCKPSVVPCLLLSLSRIIQKLRKQKREIKTFVVGAGGRRQEAEKEKVGGGCLPGALR